MEKSILSDYIDACELIRETEADIRALKKRRKNIVVDSVKGSMREHPYAAQNFRIQGLSYNVITDPDELGRQEQILEARKANAEKIKTQVEEWMNTIPMRMQRIIRMKIFERRTWEGVAEKLGRGVSGEVARKEFENFMKNN